MGSVKHRFNPASPPTTAWTEEVTRKDVLINLCSGNAKSGGDRQKSTEQEQHGRTGEGGSDQFDCNIVGEWRRCELVGRGAYGVVYRGELVATGQSIAVKQIQTTGTQKSKLQAAENEIRMVRHLQHPNVVQFLGTEKAEDCLSIFLEYLDGGSLRVRLQRDGRMSEEWTAEVTREILCGLRYLHSEGIAHRDIKSANVLLSKGGAVKLADFGTSKRMGHESVLSGIKGTPHWMAPEVIRGQQEPTGWFKADVWSVGCTVVEMLTGKMPWPDVPNAMAVMFQIAQGQSPPLDIEVSSAARSFIKACCVSDPRERYCVEQLLEHPFLQDQMQLPSMTMQRSAPPSLDSQRGISTPMSVLNLNVPQTTGDDLSLVSSTTDSLSRCRRRQISATGFPVDEDSIERVTRDEIGLGNTDECHGHGKGGGGCDTPGGEIIVPRGGRIDDPALCKEATYSHTSRQYRRRQRPSCRARQCPGSGSYQKSCLFPSPLSRRERGTPGLVGDCALSTFSGTISPSEAFVLSSRRCDKNSSNDSPGAAAVKVTAAATTLRILPPSASLSPAGFTPPLTASPSSRSVNSSGTIESPESLAGRSPYHTRCLCCPSSGDETVGGVADGYRSPRTALLPEKLPIMPTCRIFERSPWSPASGLSEASSVGGGEDRGVCPPEFQATDAEEPMESHASSLRGPWWTEISPKADLKRAHRVRSTHSPIAASSVKTIIPSSLLSSAPSLPTMGSYDLEFFSRNKSDHQDAGYRMGYKNSYSVVQAAREQVEKGDSVQEGSNGHVRGEQVKTDGRGSKKPSGVDADARNHMLHRWRATLLPMNYMHAKSMGSLRGSPKLPPLQHDAEMPVLGNTSGSQLVSPSAMLTKPTSSSLSTLHLEDLGSGTREFGKGSSSRSSGSGAGRGGRGRSVSDSIATSNALSVVSCSVSGYSDFSASSELAAKRSSGLEPCSHHRPRILRPLCDAKSTSSASTPTSASPGLAGDVRCKRWLGGRCDDGSALEFVVSPSEASLDGSIIGLRGHDIARRSERGETR